MATVPLDVPGVSESGNPVSGAPNVKGAKLAHLVSSRKGSAPGTQ